MNNLLQKVDLTVAWDLVFEFIEYVRPELANVVVDNYL